MSDWTIGKHGVLEALRSNRPVEKIMVSERLQMRSGHEIWRLAKQRGVPIQKVPRARLDKLSQGGNHQGIMALVASYQYATIDELFKRAKERNEPPFFVILDEIEDPHNLGSILRSADAAGVHGVIIPKRRAVGLNKTVAKTSAGAIEYVPVVRVTNLNRLVDELKDRGLWLVGSDGQAEQMYTEVDYNIPLALVIGNEGRGIHALLKSKCDFIVKLPMKGNVSSLNASVAAGILMYEVMRGRMKHG